MPIFDYACECGNVWENIEIWPSHVPKKCPKCQSKKFQKIFTYSNQQIRMDADVMKHNLPDPQPPLTELKPDKKSESGLADLPRTELKDYTRTKDKYGNSIWKEKRRTYFGAGGGHKSSAEKEN